eukprot:gene11107-7733_t
MVGGNAPLLDYHRHSVIEVEASFYLTAAAEIRKTLLSTHNRGNFCIVFLSLFVFIYRKILVGFIISANDPNTRKSRTKQNKKKPFMSHCAAWRRADNIQNRWTCSGKFYIAAFRSYLSLFFFFFYQDLLQAENILISSNHPKRDYASRIVDVIMRSSSGSGRSTSQSPPPPEFHATAVMRSSSGEYEDAKPSEAPSCDECPPSSKRSETLEPSTDRPSDAPESLSGTFPQRRSEPRQKTPSRERETNAASDTLEPDKPCCAALRELLMSERRKREAAEEALERVRQAERKDIKSQILEATTEPGVDVQHRLTELQMEVAKLKRELEEKSKELLQKDERIRLLQEKLVDQLLGDQDAPKVRSSAGPRARTPVSSASSFSRDASPRGTLSRTRPISTSTSTTTSVGVSNRIGRGLSPSPKDPKTSSARHSALVAVSPSNSRRPFAAAARDLPTPTRKPSAPVKPSPALLSSSALSSARKRMLSGPKTSASPSAASNASPVRAPAQRRAASAVSRPAVLEAPRRSATPQRSHPGMLSRPTVGRTSASRESSTVRASAAPSPLPRRSPSQSTSASGQVGVRSRGIVPLRCTTPTRSLYSDQAAVSRRRPRISCSVGRHDETLLKGTTTTVTFKSRGSGGGRSMASRELLSADFGISADFPTELSPIKHDRPEGNGMTPCQDSALELHFSGSDRLETEPSSVVFLYHSVELRYGGVEVDSTVSVFRSLSLYLSLLSSSSRSFLQLFVAE